MKLEKILVLDDEDGVRAVMTDLLREMGYSPLAVATIHQARGLLKQDSFDLILSDVRLSDGNGLDFLQEVRQIQPLARLVVMTGFGSLDSAVEAIRLGVFDYLVKPVNASHLKVTLERLEQFQQLQSENTYLRREVREKSMDDIEWPPERHLRSAPSVRDLALAYGVPVWAAHRALTDCTYLVQVLERCSDLEALLAAALEPRLLYRANLPYAERHRAKQAGFRWNEAVRGAWSRRLSERQAQALPFLVQRVEVDSVAA
jgi:ActR/RegA family two-component response regulator